MKKLFSAMLLCGICAASAATCAAAEPARNRQSEAGDVASFMNLEQSSYRVLTQTEAQNVRGTGGCLLPCLNLNTIAKVTADVKVNANVLGIVKVNAKVDANVKVKIK